MKTLFLFGSSKIQELCEAVKLKIKEHIERLGIEQVIVGDCVGFDSLAQKYVLSLNIPVCVYYMGARDIDVPRYMEDGCTSLRIGAVHTRRTRYYYTIKDEAMRKSCNYALGVVDGNTAGTMLNYRELLKMRKNVLLLNGEGNVLDMNHVY